MKPYVICHMVTTIDGRIMGDRWGRVAGTEGSATIFETTHDTFGVNAWLVSLLMRRAGYTAPLPACAAMLFLTFPAAVEPVAWISGAFDVMLTTLALAAAYVAIAEDASAWRAVTAAVIVAAALMVKETAIAIPVLMVAAVVAVRTLTTAGAGIWNVLALSVAVGAVVYVATLWIFFRARVARIVAFVRAIRKQHSHNL